MASSAIQRAQAAALQQQMQNVPAALRQQIANEALNSQKSVLAFPYYSTLRFDGVVTGSGPYTVTITSGTRKCFNYKVGDAGGGSATLPGNGFATTYVASYSDTNLLKPSETRDNADVLIWGLAVEVRPGSDPQLTKSVFRNAYVTLSLSGTDSYQLGRLSFFPSGGGLYGAAPSLVVPASLLDAYGAIIGHLNNGNPTAGNYFRFPQPIRWQANGSGAKDTSLVVSVTTDTAPLTNDGASASSTTYSVTARAAAASASGSTGVAAWPFVTPATSQVFCDLTFRLVSVSISERSVNA